MKLQPRVEFICPICLKNRIISLSTLYCIKNGRASGRCIKCRITNRDTEKVKQGYKIVSQKIKEWYKTHVSPLKGKKRPPFSEEHKRKISESNKGHINWKKGTGKKIEIICKGCGIKFITSHYSKKTKKYCSHKCYLKKIIPFNKGKTKFKSLEEMRQSDLASGRRSYHKHIEKRLFYYRKLAAIRRGVKGNFSKEQWNNLIKKQNYLCVICNEKKKLTIDHIIPISKWSEWTNFHKVDYECNDIQNIQALCGSCNSRKHAKILNTLLIATNKLPLALPSG